MANLIWFDGILCGLVLVIVVPRLAWYALMTYKQRRRYHRDLQLAASRGMPLPAAPSPPDLWGVTYRINRIAAVLGLAGGFIAVVVLFISGQR
jgi:hypothetical protein